MNNKIYFLSFADKRFKSTKRIEREAHDFGIFTDVLVGDESMFDKWYWDKYKHRFKDRGFGYWQWKPYLIRRLLDNIEVGDIVLFLDAGCSFNHNGIERFKDYIEILNNSKSGILVFNTGMKETAWTKGDIFSYLNVYDNPEYLNHGQVAGGIVFLKKCANSYAFVNQWYYISHNHYPLITDSPSIVPNFPDFRENRHDESVMSLLSLKYNAEELSIGETYNMDEDWTLMSKYPIWVTRYRGIRISFLKRLKRYIKKQIQK